MNKQFVRNGFGGFSFFPPVIKSLLIINVVVFLFDAFFLGIYHIENVPLSVFFAKYFYLQPIESGNFYIWQLITYQFIHGGIWHLFFNLFALWMFGVELESIWGSRKFLSFYLLSGVGAGLFQLFIAPIFSEPLPTIGASGSVFGVLTAFGFTFPNRPVFMFPIFIPIPAKFFVILYAGLAFLLGITGSAGNVAHIAHLGGAFTGFILYRFGDQIGLYRLINRLTGGSAYDVYDTYRPSSIFKRRKPVSSYYDEEEPEYYEIIDTPKKETRKSYLTYDGEEITQEMIDRILDKIAERGYQSLTEKEKRILLELSKRL
ncbi:MAG: rhomboid family intramembrane serine protease [Ignavibacteria bacterium]|nr:rhomboid family intramembrane serine protease [Ignavibacteria bacterium]